ncbi:MAG: TfoX/Sxy family protein [Thermoleophilia bacterium]|nr:TfoX/Sxy family protein [Thermoleophilia bacterium]
MTAERTEDLRNIGPITAGWLHEVGIDTPGDLRRIGAAEAYRRVKAWRPWDVTLMLLWALEGALMDEDWMDVPPDRRVELRRSVGA